MHKVLIVDDESFIRLGIKSIIDRHPSIDFEVTVCSNGLEALKVLEEQEIDILITDIKMPKLDGIGLIKRVCDRSNKPEIIILSGFDEFEYASQAIRCGVRDYLLKPVNRTELFNTLERVAGIIKEKKENSSNVRMALSYKEQYRANELNYLFLKDELSREEILSIIDKVDLEILKRDFFFGIIKRKHSTTDMNEDNLLEEVEDILGDYKRNGRIDYLAYLDPDKKLIVISRELETFQFIENYICKNNISKFFIGVYDYPSGAENIKQARKLTEQALMSRMFFNNTFLVRYSDIENKGTEYIIPRDRIERIANLLGTGRDKEIEKLIMDIMDFSIITRFEISYLEGISTEIKNQVIEAVEKKYFKDQKVHLNNHGKLKNLDNYSSFAEYFHDLKNYIMDVNDYIKNTKDIYGDKKIIERAVEYIYKNYDKEINLAVVSNEVSMNYSYFSQVFKDYTGENFVNYIQRIRIEKAKEFLRNPDYKVYEIAARVGYEDSKQFTKIFRKVTGISPREYRERQQGN
jgi:two-component system, response regulator YesN